MKKYKSYEEIRRQDISVHRGLDNEVKFTPHLSRDMNPLKVSCFGITNPDKDYYIERRPSPCYILEYIVSGVGYLEMNGSKERLCAGDAYIIHQGDFCKYYADKKEPYKKYWINFAVLPFFEEILRAYDISDRVIRGIDLGGYFEQIFKLEEFSDSNDELYIPVSKIIFSVMMDIAQHKRSGLLTKGQDLASSVKSILDRSVNTHITMDDIAKSVYRSKNEVIRQFKSRYGITPYAYLVDVRIRRAKNILQNTKVTLSELAEYLCFSSEYHFSNCFKNRTGVSPRDFRHGIRTKDSNNE